MWNVKLKFLEDVGNNKTRYLSICNQFRILREEMGETVLFVYIQCPFRGWIFLFHLLYSIKSKVLPSDHFRRSIVSPTEHCYMDWWPSSGSRALRMGEQESLQMIKKFFKYQFRPWVLEAHASKPVLEPKTAYLTLRILWIMQRLHCWPFLLYAHIQYWETFVGLHSFKEALHYSFQAN